MSKAEGGKIHWQDTYQGHVINKPLLYKDIPSNNLAFSRICYIFVMKKGLR